MNTEKLQQFKRKTIEDFPDFDYVSLGNRIAIYVPPASKISKGGIIIPDSAMKDAIMSYFDKTKYHLVISASNNAVANGINVGDFVSIDISIVNPNDFFCTPKYREDNFLSLDCFTVDGKLTEEGAKNLGELDLMPTISRPANESGPSNIILPHNRILA